MEYVIIGGGVAAVGCIEGIRSSDREGNITVISAEERKTYCRPLISYYLEGKTVLSRINYRPDSFWSENGVRLLTGRRAAALDPAAKTVSLDDSSVIGYDTLCVAAGSSPFVPPTDGLESVSRRHCFMTLDDALALEKDITPDSDVLIIGAGLIGLKCAEGIYGRVKSVTVCDLAPKVLSSILDDECAASVRALLEKKGITVMTGDTAVRFDGDRAAMKSGASLSFDVLVTAVGVRANSSLVRDAGGNVNRGIVADTHMRSSLADIYAAGDCAEGYDLSLGANRVLAILPNAYMQGYCAGVNMAGGDNVFDRGIPMNALSLFGFHIASAGCADGELFERRGENGSLRRLYVKNGALHGFIMLGDTARAGIYTSLIRENTPLADIDFDLLLDSPQLAAFPREYREKALARAH